MKKLLATITDEAYEALKAFKEENGFANIDTALDELLKRGRHAPRLGGRGI